MLQSRPRLLHYLLQDPICNSLETKRQSFGFKHDEKCFLEKIPTI
jgi:hypothetical protein